MHILIKIHHAIKSYEQFHWLTKGDEQVDGWKHTALCAHLRLVQYCLNACFAVDVKERQDRLPTGYPSFIKDHKKLGSLQTLALAQL